MIKISLLIASMAQLSNSASNEMLGKTDNVVTGTYSIIIGKGQTVTQSHHLRIGIDADHWVDIDLNTGESTLAPNMQRSEIGEMCFNAFNAARLIPEPAR